MAHIKYAHKAFQVSSFSVSQYGRRSSQASSVILLRKLSYGAQILEEMMIQDSSGRFS